MGNGRGPESESGAFQWELALPEVRPCWVSSARARARAGGGGEAPRWWDASPGPGGPERLHGGG